MSKSVILEDNDEGVYFFSLFLPWDLMIKMTEMCRIFCKYIALAFRSTVMILKTVNEPGHEKTGCLHMRKQRHRSASR